MKLAPDSMIRDYECSKSIAYVMRTIDIEYTRITERSL